MKVLKDYRVKTKEYLNAFKIIKNKKDKEKKVFMIKKK